MKNKKISSLKFKKLSRASEVLGMIVDSGQSAISYKIKKTFNPKNSQESLNENLLQQVKKLATKIGTLKGGLMKVGQMLSVYGEYFLPPEVNQHLKTLQNKSPQFEWEAIKNEISQEFSDSFFDQVDVDTKSWASASLGQVHKGTLKKDNTPLAIKVQYPNVDLAVESDIKNLKIIFSTLNLFPQISHLDILLDEIQSMMKQELDYINEMQWINKYSQKLKSSPNFILPKCLEEFTTSKIITMTFEDGLSVDSNEIKNLDEERKNNIALSFLELYFMELFMWGFVQTDPHIGNYKIRLNENMKDQIVLYDFGAVREFSRDFLINYRALIKASLNKDLVALEKYSLELKFILKDDPEDLKKLFFDFCLLMVEPFEGRVYDWSKTDLPKRLTSMITKVIKGYHIRTPPREVVFLDRKTTGVFIFMSILGAKVDARKLLEKYLDLTL